MSKPADLQALFPGRTLEQIEGLLGLVNCEDEDYQDLLQRMVAANPQALWTPLPGPQTMASESLADVIGYGGAAGGGKSDLLLGLALCEHEAVQIFRREGTELLGLVERTATILGHRRGLGGKPAIWRQPTDRCRIIEFCSVPHPGDEAKYQGRGKDLIGFDEAANFLERQVRFVMGWNRTTTFGQRLRTILTFNPPTTVEGRWIIDFFGPWLNKKHPNPAKPGELRWIAVLEGRDVEVDTGKPFVVVKKERVYDFDPEKYKPTEIVQPLTRTFVPSRVTDNPHLMRTGYVSMLQGMPEPFRSQMLDGDFQAGVQDDPNQVIATANVEAAMARWKKLDQLPPMDSVGADIAMRGSDRTVVSRRHAAWFNELIVHPGPTCEDGPTVAGFLVAAQRSHAPIHLDLFGVGAEPYGHLMKAGIQVIGVNMGDTRVPGVDASGRLQFVNWRSWLWWQMREALLPESNLGIALPPDKELLLELTIVKFDMRSGKVQVEDRKAIIERLGRSPDKATAVILALMRTPKLIDLENNKKKRRREDYDPHEESTSRASGRRRRSSTDD